MNKKEFLAEQFEEARQETKTTAEKMLSGSIKGNERKPAEEKRSERVQVLFTPPTLEALRKLARIQSKKTSLNDLINTIIEQYVEENRETLETISKLLGDK